MGNPLFNALSGNTSQGTPNMVQQFQQFMSQTQGKNPREEINRLLQSGQISQQQLNQAQQMAHQLSNMFKGFK